MSKRVSWGVVADPHLWRLIMLSVNRMTGDSEAAIADVFAQSAAAGDEGLAAAGDLFNRGDSGGVAYARKVLLDAHQAGGSRPFWFIVGNHEDSGSTAGYRNPAWLDDGGAPKQGIVHLTPAVVTSPMGVRVCGMDYCDDPALREQTLLAIRKLHPHVLLLHGSVDKLCPGYVSMFATNELDGIADVIVIGDTHIHASWEGESSLFISPGSTIRQRITDFVSMPSGQAAPDTVGFYGLEMEFDDSGRMTGKTATYRPIRPEAQRLFFSFRLNTNEEAVAAAEAVSAAMSAHACPPELKNPYIRILHHPDVFPEALFREKFPDAHMEVRPTADITADSIKLEVPEGDGTMDTDAAIREAVISRHTVNDDDPRVGRTVRAILDPAQDPAAVVQTVVQDILSGKEETCA